MWFKLLQSSTFRVAVVYMVLFGVSSAVLLGFIYWATAGYMARQADATIEAEIEGLAEHYRQRGFEGLSRVLRERVARDPGGSSVYLFATPDYRALAGNLSRWPAATPSPDGWINFRLEPAGPDAIARRARAREFVLQGGLHLLVGREVNELEEIRALVRRALAWGLALTIALAIAGGTAMSRTTVRRIDAINQTSREIMGGQLSRRIPTKGTGDDFDQLADNLNAMLDQIERLMNGVRQVSDDVAHDLRTPLSRLQHRLEALRDVHPGPDARFLVEESIAEAERLLTTFNALLRIARIEAGSGSGERAPIDLPALVRDVVELYEPLAEKKGQIFELGPFDDVEVNGDRDLVFQAVANVVDNAVKFTGGSGHIVLAVCTAQGSDSPSDSFRYPSRPLIGHGVAVVVGDSGPGIPRDAREKVFERFHRLEASRQLPGNGLGLSMTAAVMALHSGYVELSGEELGLTVRLVFPADHD